MKKNIYKIIILIIAATFVCSCQGKEDLEDPSLIAVEEDIIPTQKYVGIYPMASYDYFTDHKRGFVLAGEELNVIATYMGPAENDIAAMEECFQSAIAEQVDGIILFGADDSFAFLINQAAKAGIPTVTVDGDVKESDRIAFVGTNNIQAGMTGGELIAEILDYSGSVGVLTEPDVDLHVDRTNGYATVIDKYPEMEIVAIADTKATPDFAYEAAKNLILDYPELDAIVCTDYFGGIGASVAVEELDKVGEIKIVSMDRNKYVLDKIEDGVISATLVQQTALMPYYAMKILHDYVNKSIQIVADNEKANVTGVPAYIDTGVIIVDKSNYIEFYRN